MNSPGHGKIRDKQEFYRLWSAGVLGNKLRTWTSLQDALDAGLERYALREQARAGGGLHLFVPSVALTNAFYDWSFCDRKFFIAETAEDEYQTLQGEVCRTFRGWEGTLGASKLPMREAAASGLLLPRSGATVRALLRRFVDPSSLDDIDELFELFPDATVEFTAFSKDVGCIPNRNTVIWEVRDY